MFEGSKFFVSATEAHTAIDCAIDVLQKWKIRIDDDNCDKFGLDINEHRELEPIQNVKKVVGFRQMSPITLSIVLNDCSMLGSDLVPDPEDKNHTPWSCPSQSEVSAVDDHLKRFSRMRKSLQCPKVPRGKKIAKIGPNRSR